jgi:RNA polymerase sigma-70 factor, ECF subfamily
MGPGDRKPLEEPLDLLLERCRSTWPGVAVDTEDFVRHLGAMTGGVPDAAERLQTLHCTDVYLAFALARGDQAALTLFEARHMPAVADYVARIDGTAEFARAVQQRVRERLFVPSGESAAKIASYRGRGPLAGWLRVLATRIAYDLKAQARRDPATEPRRLEDLAELRTPELELMRAQHRSAFKLAFEEALDALEPEDRVMLSLYFLDGMTVEEIGALYRVHKSTITRRLARTRERILEQVASLLGQRLKLGRSEIASVVKLARSQIDVSLRRLLKNDP